MTPAARRTWPSDGTPTGRSRRRLQHDSSSGGARSRRCGDPHTRSKRVRAPWEDVDATGELQADRVEAAIGAISALAAAAREAGAHDIIAIATSAVRDAHNGPAFAEQVLQETGVRLEIVSGERESQLTFRGATLGVSMNGG